MERELRVESRLSGYREGPVFAVNKACPDSGERTCLNVSTGGTILVHFDIEMMERRPSPVLPPLTETKQNTRWRHAKRRPCSCVNSGERTES